MFGDQYAAQQLRRPVEAEADADEHVDADKEKWDKGKERKEAKDAAGVEAGIVVGEGRVHP